MQLKLKMMAPVKRGVMEHLDWTQDLMEDDNGKNNCIHTRTETRL
jgi:hypothetical protein